MASRVMIAIAVVMLVGCSAVGVVATTDPDRKLAQATELFDKLDRPLPAERLIREAIDIYEQDRNKIGLGDAYSTYGFFFRSPSVERWQRVYRAGFLEPGATLENRLERSVAYFERAAQIYRDAALFDRLTNAQFNMGVSYVLMNRDREACAAYDASTLSQRLALEANPAYRPRLLGGFTDWNAFIGDAKRRIGCAS